MILQSELQFRSVTNYIYGYSLSIVWNARGIINASNKISEDDDADDDDDDYDDIDDDDDD